MNSTLEKLSGSVPVRSGYLAVPGGHDIYWQDIGDATGRPVMFLHGGPGGGSSPDFLQAFDLRRHRVVMFDQRGCGMSRPWLGLQENTTGRLLDDIDAVRVHLGIDAMCLMGSSWGATLAVEYAKRRPGAVLGLILHGLFLGRRKDVERFLYGARSSYPQAWMQFSAHLPEEERNDLLKGYHDRLTTGCKARIETAALSWSRYEALIGQYPSIRHENIVIKKSAALAMAILSVHYFSNGCFLPEGGILDGIQSLSETPLALIHGENDLVCGAADAVDAVGALPRASTRLIPRAGHFPSTPQYWSALRDAVSKVAEPS